MTERCIKSKSCRSFSSLSFVSFEIGGFVVAVGGFVTFKAIGSLTGDGGVVDIVRVAVLFR